MNAAAIALLASVTAEIPELGDLQWLVEGGCASASLYALGGMRTEYTKDGEGKVGGTLVVTPPPDALRLVCRLHEAGWKRAGHWEQWGWELFALLQRDGAALVVGGSTRSEPEHGNRALPFFAPAPPEVPVRMSKAWRAEYEEWDRKCREREW
jgi:hypothetical protein